MRFLNRLLGRGKSSEEQTSFIPKQYRDGDSVKCQKCGHSIIVRTSDKAVSLSTYDAVKKVAFRCQQCDFITCSSCATRGAQPQCDMMVCPSCGSKGGPFFFD